MKKHLLLLINSCSKRVTIFSSIVFFVFFIIFSLELNLLLFGVTFSSNSFTSQNDLKLPSNFRKVLPPIKGTFCEVVPIGCFEISTLGKSQFVVRNVNNTITRRSCVIACSARKAFYAGLLNARKCLCSLSVASEIANTLKASNKCNVPCAGDSNQTCGGRKSIEVFRIKTACLKSETELLPNFEHFHFIGCFKHEFETQKMFYQNNSQQCILQCGLEGSLLAVWNGKYNACLCEQFSESFNLKQKQLQCSSSSFNVYRTLVHNSLCHPLRFLPENSPVKRIALLSAPGSGNTWSRHLIEQASGIYTGSYFSDFRLDRSGFLGERLDLSLNRSFVIKHHMYKRNHMFLFDGIILLVRNPYKAAIAEFNRRRSPGYNNRGFANSSLFYSAEYDSYLNEFMNSWIQLFSWLIDSKKPFYLLKYEDLLQHPVDEIRKVMEFLKAKSGFEPANLEQRLLCMSENLQGMYKRKSRKLKEFLYTEKMKTKIDSIIKDARLILSSADDNLKLPNYKPII